jgi:hypothetical protein
MGMIALTHLGEDVREKAKCRKRNQHRAIGINLQRYTCGFFADPGKLFKFSADSLARFRSGSVGSRSSSIPAVNEECHAEVAPAHKR